MIKRNLIILLVLISAFAFSQDQNYYEFMHNEKYGIVDSKGEEIVSPKYDWKLYILDYQSPYIVLMSKTINPLIYNKITGESESIKYITGAYRIDYNNDKYIYIYNDQDGYLMNNKDLKKREKLPKRYQNVIQEKEFLIAYSDKSKNADIISKKDLNKIIDNLEVKNIESYEENSGKLIYVINQKNGTLFFNEDFKEIVRTKKKLKDFDEVFAFLKSKNIVIKNNVYDIISTTTGPPPEYPHIDVKKGMETNLICEIIYRNEKKDYFSYNPKHFKTSLDSYDNNLTLSRKVENRVFHHILFYVNPKEKIILFPKKYWKDIDLVLLEN